MARRVRLIDEIVRTHPGLSDPERAVEGSRVLVNGSVVTNPRSLVERGCSIVVREPAEFRGSVKLRAALDRSGVSVDGRVALDVGAAAGGFTTVLLERGARRVYAVDVGHGQLIGSLRQDTRVVTLEATNVADLGPDLIAEPIDVVTIDVSYLSLSQAVVQLEPVPFAPGAELVGLVKPMFELKLASAPSDRTSLDHALDRAVDGLEAAGWDVVSTMDSPVTGAKGAPELFVFARRRADDG